MKKVYVLTQHDIVHSGVDCVLRQMGAKVIPARAGERLQALEDEEVVAVMFAARGHFPSKHLRCLESLEKAAERGFKVHRLLESFLAGTKARVIVVRVPEMGVPLYPMPQRLREALANVHLRTQLGVWTGPKRKRLSRLARKRERRAERRQEYLLA